MKLEIERCKDGELFCPVAYKKYGGLFWPLFGVTAAAAVVLNLLFDAPILLILYGYPILFVGMWGFSLPFFSVLSVGLLGSVFLVVPPQPLLFVAAAAIAGLMFIVRRIVYISNNNHQSRTEQEETLLNTVFTLAKTIDTRDPYTAFHSNNVAEYARSIAKEMGLPQQQIDAVYLAGLIHDIGKIGTPDAVLQKESRLTEEEYAIMKKHPEDGYLIVKDIKLVARLGIDQMVRHHHERIDGKGYPLGLKGTDIPLGARILGVADAFDAMTTNRSYRQKLAVETAADELQRHSGAQFDPIAASAMLKVLERDGKLQTKQEQIDGVRGTAQAMLA